MARPGNTVSRGVTIGSRCPWPSGATLPPSGGLPADDAGLARPGDRFQSAEPMRVVLREVAQEQRHDLGAQTSNLLVRRMAIRIVHGGQVVRVSVPCGGQTAEALLHRFRRRSRRRLDRNCGHDTPSKRTREMDRRASSLLDYRRSAAETHRRGLTTAAVALSRPRPHASSSAVCNGPLPASASLEKGSSDPSVAVSSRRPRHQHHAAGHVPDVVVEGPEAVERPAATHARFIAVEPVAAQRPACSEKQRYQSSCAFLAARSGGKPVASIASSSLAARLVRSRPAHPGAATLRRVKQLIPDGPAPPRRPARRRPAIRSRRNREGESWT